MFELLGLLISAFAPKPYMAFVGSTLGVLAIAGAASSVATSVIGAKAAKKAGKVQARGAERAAELQAQSAREALAFNRQVYRQQQTDYQPYLQTGRTGLANLSHLMGLPSNYQAPQQAAPQIPRPRIPGGTPGATGPRRDELMLSQMMQQRRA